MHICGSGTDVTWTIRFSSTFFRGADQLKWQRGTCRLDGCGLQAAVNALGYPQTPWLSNLKAMLSWGQVGGQSAWCWNETVSLQRISKITSLPHASGMANNFFVFMLKLNDFIITDIPQGFNCEIWDIVHPSAISAFCLVCAQHLYFPHYLSMWLLALLSIKKTNRLYNSKLSLHLHH